MKMQILSVVLLMSATLFSCQNKSNEDFSIIKISGSDTEFDLVSDLVDNYKLENNIEILVEKGGSSIGINNIINKQVNIANSSRELFDYEYDVAKQNNVNLVPIIIATDAIAFVTHPSNPVDSLSTIQLSKVLSGEINNWEQLGGPNKRIILHGRNDLSGTQAFLKRRFLQDEDFPKGTISHENNQEIINAIKIDTFGIGYVGAGFLIDETGKPNHEIWALYLYTEGDNQAFSPYQYQAVVQGEYPLTRPLYQIFDGVPTHELKKLLDFELSDEGQDIIRENGFFPITSYYEFLNSAYLNSTEKEVEL